jgi:hypothetical protein
VSTHRMPNEAGPTSPANDEGCAACRPAHPSCSSENSHTDCAQEAKESKRRATLTAHLARRGFALHCTDAGTFIVARWNLVRELSGLDAVAEFARRVGAQPANECECAIAERA